MRGIICLLLTLYILSFVVRILLEWIRIPYDSPFAGVVRLLHAGTDPLLKPVQKRMRPVMVGEVAIDLSATVVIIGLILVSRIICG